MNTLRTSRTSPSGQYRLSLRAAVVLGVLSGSQLLIVVDATIVNVALGPIRAGLGFSAAQLQWVITAYTLAFGGLLLVGGKVADRFGHRRMFLLGAVAFGVASLAGGAAGHQLVLVGARAVQGAGAALMAPAAMALVMDVFAPGKGRTLAFGIWAGVTAGGTALGSVVGGVLTEVSSWRWVLWINVPIVAVVIVLGLLVLPPARGVRGSAIDLAGAATATGGLTLLVFGLIRASEHGWNAATVLVLLVAVALLVVFVVLQVTRRAKLVPAGVLGSRAVVAADIAGLILGVAIYALFFFVSLFLSTVQGRDPVYVGLAFVPMTAAVAVAARISGALAERIRPGRLSAAGVALVAIGLALLARIEPASGYATILLPGLVVAGFGLGLTFVPLTAAAMSSAGPADSGIASALFNAAQQIGGALGLAVLTTISTSVATTASPEAVTHGWSAALLAAAALTIAAAAMLPALIMPSRPADDAPYRKGLE
ncbi:MFS transporter [Kribbella solani]|uniref:MFS transporter n=1 Tax=Kribbella solani TaxID=236067 RepID=UPI0029AFD7F3|nr:MFS transporter [Kribbella solani]MDX2969631.1 MFS transporter [Kribbella solani]